MNQKFWYLHKKNENMLTQKHIQECSQHLYSKQPKTGNNSSIHQDEWINKMESICAINTFQLE